MDVDVVEKKIQRGVSDWYARQHDSNEQKTKRTAYDLCTDQIIQNVFTDYLLEDKDKAKENPN